MSKKVSIVVPLYKSEKYLDKLICSILIQTYRNIELILVDDGSPDNSGVIADRYAATDDRIKVIHKENGGTCDARNAGLKSVTGEYLMFADGDDWLDINCVEYLVKIAEDNNAEMSMTDCVFTTMDLHQNDKDIVKVLTPEEATCIILYVKTPVGPWNKLYTTEIIKNNNLTFSVPWFGEGLYFSAMAAQMSNRVAMGHKKVYVYRKNNPNSGTAIREVQNGINSLNNIIYIKDNLIIKTPKTEMAADWHIWKNNFNLIMYITGANANHEYSRELESCKKEMRRLMWPSILHADISFKYKVYTVLLTLFPILGSKLALYIKRINFNRDLNRMRNK